METEPAIPENTPLPHQAAITDALAAARTLGFTPTWRELYVAVRRRTNAPGVGVLHAIDDYCKLREPEIMARKAASVSHDRMIALSTLAWIALIVATFLLHHPAASLAILIAGPITLIFYAALRPKLRRF
jgi:hypothetical protein